MWVPAWAVIGSLVMVIGMVVSNIFGNLLSPMNDLLNLAPDRLHRTVGEERVAFLRPQGRDESTQLLMVTHSAWAMITHDDS